VTGELEDKVAIVTGAARGIGRETAAVLAEAGAAVVLAGPLDDDLSTATAAASVLGTAALCEVDISDEASVEALIQFTLSTFGRLDVLDNNAALMGLSDDAPVGEMSVELWDEMFAVNARGTMLMCKHAVGPMSEGGGGSIINITSGTATHGMLGQTAYACSKGAIETLTRYVATQYGHRGIRCNSIAPGVVLTDALAAGMPEAFQEAQLGSQLVPRLGTPRDIAEMVRFLASDRAGWITGQICSVEGGATAHVASLDAQRRLLAELGDSGR
jgi:NAD(P)-dependent dehydrogenase (short-subunit alcohol dehydrogenase family)